MSALVNKASKKAPGRAFLESLPPSNSYLDRDLTYIDLFAGCGGLSLGLALGGWKGLFAVEKNADAFATLKHNLIDRRGKIGYNWPGWLPKENLEIGSFIKKYSGQLESLRGQVDLIAGGPPCQGFSLLGKRDENDPRNKLFKQYVKMVEIIRPSFLILENVKGISIEHGVEKWGNDNFIYSKPFARRIHESLEKIGYKVYTRVLKAVDYGIPQIRPRFIFIGIDERLLDDENEVDPFAILDLQRDKFLKRKGLPTDRPVTVREAISDLETRGKEFQECVDSKGFKQIVYEGPESFYQELMQARRKGITPNSLRLANHRPETLERFKKILKTCRKGVQLSREDRERLGLKKFCTVPLDGDKPSHTLTTLPDDILHYSEPRILSVREYARIQSFPDWFAFQGKYTTGGERRVLDCPRYTQVGNAVPPLLAELLGVVLKELYHNLLLDV